MEKEKFEKYLKERYYDQIGYYDSKSVSSKKWYSVFQWGLIIFSAITPVLVASNIAIEDYFILKWITFGTSLIVAIFSTALKTFKFQEQSINFRTTCETLKKEIYLYEAQIREYALDTDRESLFINRVENLISRENTLWLTTYKEDDKKNNKS